MTARPSSSLWRRRLTASMTDYLAIPPAREVRGIVVAPPSKSATNRAFVLAALSESPVELVRPLESEDTAALRLALTALGASIATCEEGVRIRGPLSGPAERETLLDAGESGTAARFLAALATVTPGRFRLTGSRGLLERPIGELVCALRSNGADIEFLEQEGHLPLFIRGATLRPGRIAVDASRSSQFLSALLLAGVALDDGLEVAVIGPLASAPYVAMTLASLRSFGHEVSEGPPFRVTRGARSIGRYEVPGDFSSALPLLAAAGVAGGEVAVRGLTWPSGEADALALPVLERMGLRIEAGPEQVRASMSGGPRALRPVTVHATDFPDAVPTLAALAAFASGRSQFDGIGHLRWKESDRIEALAQLLSRAGSRTITQPSRLAIDGPLAEAGERVCRLPTFGDHRIAMAAALLSLGRAGLLIENPACVAKSYPGFFSDLESLVVRKTQDRRR